MSDAQIVRAPRNDQGFGEQPSRNNLESSGVFSLGSYRSRMLLPDTGLMYGSEPQVRIGQQSINMALGPFRPKPQIIVTRFNFSFDSLPPDPSSELTRTSEDCWFDVMAPNIESVARLGTNLSQPNSTSLSEPLETLLLNVSRIISPDLTTKVQELLSLKAGWDGEDAKAVRVEDLANATMLLRVLKQEHSSFILPFIAPTFEGSVLLDWTSPRRSLEVQAESNGWSVVGTMTDSNGRKEYFSEQCDSTGLGIIKYYEWFRDGLLVWPT